VEIVTTPSYRWLERAARACKYSATIASPFVGDELIKFLSRFPSSAKVTLLTRTRLVDFAAGASDITALTKIADTATVLGLDRLHAKVYVFDERQALVTSANATNSGWHRNAECGVGLDDNTIARHLAGLVQSGFGAMPGPSRWTASQLATLVTSVERLKSRLPNRHQIRLLEQDSSETLEMPRVEAEDLLPRSAGWTHLVFQQLIRSGLRDFSTDDVFKACAPAIAQRFPANRHPREKLRQQLQVLRDLGLVQFLTPGHYRLSITTSS
jgi:phosphatidylserine/phosphatidylglycerophosphate/cardiolipin synthase-like enzyme